MIGRFIYGESCQGTLNYVFGKEGMRILGYGNTFSQRISPKFFGSLLHFQGQRNATKNRYAHISLNLPHGEHLDDTAFHEISREYMRQMGYGKQPYVVVRHTDTKHEHVHIVTTNVDEAGKVLNIFNSHRRNMATQRYLEKKYGLSPSPSAKQERELPLYRSPQLHFDLDPSQGTKFYLQDVLNGILQKYKVRSFEELAKLAEPYHVEIKRTKSESGRIGVAYGLNNRRGYRTRFISGPKLQRVFDSHSISKLLPMHRKRLLKQIETTYGLFKTIKPNELADVLKEYQDIDIKLDRKGDAIVGCTIHDRSGYVFAEKEIGQNIRIQDRSDIFGDGYRPTEIDTGSRQFKLEIQKLIREAFRTSYLKGPIQERLFSEQISTKKFDDLYNALTASKNYGFLDRHFPRNKKIMLRKTMEREFPTVKERLFELESKKEMETLESKFRLIGNVLEKGMFGVGTKQGSVRLLFRSLGVKYHDNKLSFFNSNRHTVPVPLGHLPFPKAMENQVSTGFVRQNHLMLEMLSGQSSENSKKLTASAIFLPMAFPKLYGTMGSIYGQQYESAALGSYVKHSERVHATHEKSPKDYIAFFNAKGFYFEKGENGFEVRSIYTDNKTSCPLSKRTNLYLNSATDLSRTLKEQQAVIDGLIKDGRNNLKNLWAGHLMERGLYDRAAFMLTAEKMYPNLHPEIVRHHMDSGLRRSMNEALKRQSGIRQNRLLWKGVYAISSLLGERGREQEEVFNGFKDELTDYSRFKSRGLSF